MTHPTLSETSIKEAYAKACVDLYRDWQTLGAAARRSMIHEAVRVAARGASLPEFGVAFSKLGARGSGKFDQLNWRLDINSVESDVHGMSQTAFVAFCSVLYHEARHGEQWYRCCQGALAGALTNPWLDGINVTASHIATVMYLPRNVVDHAAARGKISWVRYSAELPVAGWFESIWGINRAHRGHVLAHRNTMYAQYLLLPEEVDAFALQHEIEALITPLLAGVSQHVIEPAAPVGTLREEHARAISGPTGLEAQLRAVRLRHVALPENVSKVSALTQQHRDAIAQSSSVVPSADASAPSRASSRVRDLVAAMNSLHKVSGRVP